MASKPVRLLLALLGAVLLIVGAAALGLFPLNLNFLKEPLAEAVHDQLGMNLDIEGPLRLRLGFSPELSASGLKLRSSPDDSELLVIDRLSLGPAIRDLLRGRLHLRHLEAQGIQLDYCPESLPQLASTADDPTTPARSVELEEIRLHQIRPGCDKPDRRVKFIPETLGIRASAALGQPLKLSIDGSGPAGAVRFSVRGDSLESLLDDEQDYELNAEFKIPALEGGFTGTLTRSGERRLDGRVEVQTPEAAKAAEFFGVRIDSLGPGRASARLSAGAGLIELDEFFAEALGNAMTGGGSIALGESRPRIDLDLAFEKFDWAALAARFSDPGRESSQPLNLDPVYRALNAVDGQVGIRVDRLTGAPLTVENLVLDTALEAGLVRLQGHTPSLNGSAAEVELSLNTAEDCPTLSTGLSFSGLDLAGLGFLLDDPVALNGRAELVRLDIDSCGNAPADLLDNLVARSSLEGLSASWQGQPLPLDVDMLKIEAAWQKPGDLSLRGALLERDVTSEFAFGAMRALFSGNDWPLSFSLHSAETTLNLNGTARKPGEDLEFNGDLRWDIKRFGSLHEWIGSDQDNHLRFNGHTGLKLDRDLLFDGIEAQLGRSDLAGTAWWPGPGSGRSADIRLDSGRLDLQELSTLFSKKPRESGQAQNGFVEMLHDVEQIRRWLDLPRFDIRARIGELAGTAYDIREVSANAALSNGMTRDGRLSARIENVLVEGTLDADFRQQPGNALVEFTLGEVDIGALLKTMDLAEGVDARAESLALRVQTAGNSLAELVSGADIEMLMEELEWRLEAGPDKLVQELALQRLELVTSPGKPLDWRSIGSLNDFPVKAWMRTPSLRALFDAQHALPLTMVLGVGNDVLMLDGALGRSSSNRRQGKLAFSGTKMELGDVDFATLVSPLGDYSVAGDISLAPGELQVSNVEIAIGESRVGGNLGLRYSKPLYLLEVELSSPYLDTDDLLGLTREYRKSAAIIRAAEGPEPAKPGADASIAALLHEQFDRLVDKLHFDVELDIVELRSGGEPLGKMELGSKLTNDGLVVDLDIRNEGKDIRLDYRSLASGGITENRLDFNIERLDYGGLLRLLNPESRAAGVLYADIELRSRTPDPARSAQHTEGHFDLVAFPESAEAGFLDLWASNLVLALLPKSEKSGKQMNCMVARFEVEEGVMKSRNTFLDSTDIIVRARGEIDLVNRELDLLVAPQAKTERFFSVSTPIEVTGSFNDFKVGVAPGGFLTTMIRWYYGLVYVPWKWLTGERFPKDGIATCYRAMDWELPEER